VRNQALASLATLTAAREMRLRLLDYQKEYYRRSGADARKEDVQGYVFDTRGSKSVAFHFLENMARHHIDVYHPAKDISVGTDRFKKEEAYVIPVAQKYSIMVKTLMEDMLEYNDSTFYDISAWTFPHAFNLHYAPLRSVSGLLGDWVTDNPFPVGQMIGGKSGIGYLFENTEFYAPKIVYELQLKGVRVSAGKRPFRFKNGDVEKQMGYGTYQVLVQNQALSADELYHTLTELAQITGVDVYSAATGLMEDIDMGSPAFKPLAQPRVAVLTGRGTGISDSGEIWFLLDRRFQMRPVLIESLSLTAKELQAYNVIILPNGIPNLNKTGEAALKEWVAAGGTLIATGKAYEWLDKNGLLSLKTKSVAQTMDNISSKENADAPGSKDDDNFPEKGDTITYRPFAEKAESGAGKSIDGVILNCRLDKTHPLCWGLDQEEIAVMKNNSIIFRKDKDPYASPLYYREQPLLSGFLSDSNRKLLADTPAAFAKPCKNGLVIVFADDMNFRSYFFATSKLFMNALFYNTCIRDGYKSYY
jgi:hypothetical protein